MKDTTAPTTLPSNSNLANLHIVNARLPGYKDLQQLWINEKGVIAEIAPNHTTITIDNATLKQLQVLDVEGDWISLGGVDLQINGALGLAFVELDSENSHQLETICQFLWEQGIDAFLPTLVTTSIEKTQRALFIIADFIQNSTRPKKAAAQILGVHLEGPFLNPDKRGAHPIEYLMPLTMANVKSLVSEWAKIIKIITLAPELDASGKTIPYLRSLGITISLGHSLATFAQAQQAFAQGASMVTHAFNAMPGLHHREPGLLGAAILHPNVYCGVIADGKHVCAAMLELLLRGSFYEKGVFLVSDALAPLGLPDGIYPWERRYIEVKNGTAWVRPDYHTPLHLLNTLAGTTLPLLVGVQNLVKWGICKVESAIALATESPRLAIGLPGLEIGVPATLLRWHLDESTASLSWQRLCQ